MSHHHALMRDSRSGHAAPPIATLCLLWVALLSGCAVGPDYVRPAPSVALPQSFKEGDGWSGWKVAAPRDHETRGRWWAVYGDPVLDRLMESVNISNQNLAQAEAQYRQALALVGSASAPLLPTVTAGVSTTRSRASATTTSATNAATPGVVVNHNLPLSATWEADVWGQVRRSIEASDAGAQSSFANIEVVRLSAQATLAQDYFLLRSLDAQKKLYEDTIAAYEKSLQLVQNQYNAGVVAKPDLVQAQVQLKTAQAQAIDLGVQRAQLEHAIALLAGQAPSTFSISRGPFNASVPSIPAVVPSELLERRPDIAAAERKVAQANAQIGVAKAAFFPTLTLTAGTGFQSATMAQWLTAPSRFWSIGPALAETLFDGGLRRAQNAQAVAAYDASVAAYRQTVLTGFQQVEDNLAVLRILEQEARTQDEALRLARQSVTLTLNQYKAGTVSHINVVTVTATALAAERTAFDLANRRLVASVQLITALGGGWESTQENAAR